MHYVQIPKTNLQVASICFGTANIGSTIDRNTSFALLDQYRASGGNFIDTALVYANWLPIEPSISEKTIGAWLKDRGCRDEMVVATKGAHPDLATMHIPRMSPAEIAHDIEASRAHLGLDTIDLYWLHRDAPDWPVGEIVETLNEHVRAGTIRTFGCSNWRAPRIAAAQAYAAERDLRGFVADQMMWSLAAIDPNAVADKTTPPMDQDLLRYHRDSGMAAIPFSSQAGGLFSKLDQAARDGSPATVPPMYNLPENHARLDRLQRLAAELGANVTALALAYLQSQPFPVIPIVGCRTAAQLADSLAAADLRLTPAQLTYLDAGAGAEQPV